MLPLSQVFDFPSHIRDAILAGVLLLIPLCAQLIATYLRLQLNCLRQQIDANTQLTQQTLTKIQEHTEACTGHPTELHTEEV
jgi:hypothetical protein